MPLVTSISATTKEMFTVSKKILRAAGYPRVSDPNLKDSPTLASQTKAIKTYCTEQDFDLEERHIYPEAHTAYLLPYRERPQLNKLFEAARKGEFDVVVVNEYSRLSRRQVEQAVIIDILEGYGVKVISITENFDDSPVGQFMKAVMAFVSEIERAKIYERCSRGKKDRIENGNLPGSGVRRYGYKYVDTKEETQARYVRNVDVIATIKDPDTGVEKDWTEPDVIAFIDMSILEGKSLRNITFTLSRMGIPTYTGKSAWHHSTVQQIAADPIYTGRATTGRFTRQENNKFSGRRVLGTQELAQGLVEPIRSIEVHEQIQERLANNKSFAIRNNQHPLSLLRAGYCRCGICNRSMNTTNHYDKRGGKEVLRPEYTCKKNNGLEGIDNRHNVTIYTHIVDREAWNLAVTHIKNPELIRERIAELRKLNNHRDDSSYIKNQLAEIKRKTNNLYALAEEATDRDMIEMLQERLVKLQKEKRGLEVLLEEENTVQEEEEKIEEAIAKFETWAARVRPLLDDPDYHPSYDDKRSAIVVLGITATVYPAGSRERYKLVVSPPNIVSLITYDR